MKKEDFYPGKIMGKLQPKEQKRKPPDHGSENPDTTQEQVSPPDTGSAGTLTDEPGSAVTRENSPLMDLLSRSTGMGDAGPESLFVMIMSGALDGLRGRATHEVVQDIRDVVVVTVSYALLVIGYYLLALYFDNDESKALSKNPFKQTSLNELARHRDMPFGRQRLGECIKAAAVDMELRRRGLVFDHLTFFHKVEIGRLKNQELRVEVAEEAFTRKLTISEVKKMVDQLLGKASSEDKRMGKAVLRKLGELARLSTDEETQQFLMNKNRLKAAFGTGETVKLLDYSRQFRKGLAESERIMRRLESSLADIVVENAKSDAELSVMDEDDASSEEDDELNGKKSATT